MPADVCDASGHRRYDVARGIFVPLPDVSRDALYELAEKEWRDPRDQAAKLIVEGLRQAGALTDERSTALTTSSREPEAVA